MPMPPAIIPAALRCTSRAPFATPDTVIPASATAGAAAKIPEKRFGRTTSATTANSTTRTPPSTVLIAIVATSLQRIARTYRHLGARGLPPQDAHVAAAERQAVGVVALQQELRRAAADAERVAERAEADLVEPRQHLAPALVQRGRDREAVADAAQPALLLEERGELRVVDAHDPLRPQRRLERVGRLGARAERRRRAREVGLGAAPLDREQVENVRRPRLRRQELREGDPGVERMRRRACGEPRAHRRLQLG